MVEARDIVAVLLAAGGSRRFGPDDKLLASVGGEALALHAARRIVELAPGRRIAVCRDGDGVLAARLAELGFDIVVNADEALGLSRSLASGIAEAGRSPALAALILLADMPFVTLGHLHQILSRFDPDVSPVVASANGEAVMPPALFARSLFGSLQLGEGDRGARTLLAGAARVPAGREELVDIDRPEDLPTR